MGERAKFGLGIPDLLATVEALRAADLLGELRLLHFHVGSQINDIAVLKDALQEAGQIYGELTKLGAPMGYLDVGGGLGIDYDGSRTASAASTNYSLQNYANDVVATVKECCEPHGIPVPTLVSESGRALASHFSVLVFDVLGAGSLPGAVPTPQEGEALILRNLRDTYAAITAPEASVEALQEAWNDALKFKHDALAAFRLGYLSLPERGLAEQLTWACCQAIAERLKGLPAATVIPEELRPCRQPWPPPTTPTSRCFARPPTPGRSTNCFRCCRSTASTKNQKPWAASPTSRAIPTAKSPASSIRPGTRGGAR